MDAVYARTNMLGRDSWLHGPGVCGGSDPADVMDGGARGGFSA